MAERLCSFPPAAVPAQDVQHLTVGGVSRAALFRRDCSTRFSRPRGDGGSGSPALAEHGQQLTHKAHLAFEADEGELRF